MGSARATLGSGALLRPEAKVVVCQAGNECKLELRVSMLMADTVLARRREKLHYVLPALSTRAFVARRGSPTSLRQESRRFAKALQMLSR